MVTVQAALLTLCFLLFASSRQVWVLYLIPVAWRLISGATLWAMGSPDYLIVLLGALLIVVEVLFNITGKLFGGAG